MKIVQLSKAQRDWWPAVHRVRRTPEQWHAVNWSTSPFYRDLVQEMARHVFRPGVRFLFQREPNLRIHPVGGVAVPWHADRDFGHHPAEMNVWIPLTPMVDDTQRVWFEDDQGKPYCPDVDLGQALIFPGAVMEHGNRINTSGLERRSFDFRLVNAAHFTDRGKRTVNYDVAMRVGEYWTESLVPA